MTLRTALSAAAVLLWAVSSAAIAQAPQPRLPTERLDIVTARGVRHFTVEVADTDAERETGLMFRNSLPDDGGMLFDFKAQAPVSFWMHNTVIPLDMLFIARDGRIVSIARNARPYSDTPIPSGRPVLAVLEIRGGEASALGVKVGDRVRERIFHP